MGRSCSFAGSIFKTMQQISNDCGIGGLYQKLGKFYVGPYESNMNPTLHEPQIKLFTSSPPKVYCPKMA